MEFSDDLLHKLRIQEGSYFRYMLGHKVSLLLAALLANSVKVPEVPEIANLLRLLFTSTGKLTKRFSQELIQEFGFLKLYE